MQDRISREIQHGRVLANKGAEEIWNWRSPAGKLRWGRRVKMLSSHLKLGMTVLELGCGTGYFTRELARSGADIVAIDVSPELLEIASANCSVPNVRYEIQNAYELSYPDAVFDSVVGSSVLHHLEIDPFDFLHPKTPVPLVKRLNSVGPIPRKRAGDLAVCRLVLYPSS